MIERSFDKILAVTDFGELGASGELTASEHAISQTKERDGGFHRLIVVIRSRA
jgi:hypothetical protein